MTDLSLPNQPSPVVASRRMLAFGSTAAALVGFVNARPSTSAPTSTASAIAVIGDSGVDAEIVRLANIIMADHEISMRLCDEDDASPTRKRSAEIRKQQREITERNWELRFRLVTMPATTFSGFRAKARVVHEFNGCSDGYADGFEDDALAWSLASDLLGRPCILEKEADDAGWTPTLAPTFEEQYPAWRRDHADMAGHLAQAAIDRPVLGACEDLQGLDFIDIEQGWLDTPDAYAALQAELEATHTRYAAATQALRGQLIRLGAARLQASMPAMSEDEA